MTNEQILFPCPFCGDDGDKGRQVVTQMVADRPTFTRITCRCCGAMCPEHNWNHRAASERPTPTEAAGEPIVDAMKGYVRRCQCGGMPKKTAEAIIAAVTDAARLGYFAAPAPEQGKAS